MMVYFEHAHHTLTSIAHCVSFQNKKFMYIHCVLLRPVAARSHSCFLDEQTTEAEVETNRNVIQLLSVCLKALSLNCVH